MPHDCAAVIKSNQIKCAVVLTISGCCLLFLAFVALFGHVWPLMATIGLLFFGRFWPFFVQLIAGFGCLSLPRAAHLRRRHQPGPMRAEAQGDAGRHRRGVPQAERQLRQRPVRRVVDAAEQRGQRSRRRHSWGGRAGERRPGLGGPD